MSLAPVLPVARLLGQEHEPDGRARRREAALRRQRDSVVADLGRPRDDAEHDGVSADRSEMTPVATLDCEHERDDLGPVLAERPRAGARGNRRSASSPGRADDRRRDDLADGERRERLRHAERGADQDRERAGSPSSPRSQPRRS